ncbi:hypothetical protein QBC43DRAFT_218302 [Cladorrhinum sp. PSN259]|nr:hypothetical protein QBC43DRAFT_218302 [Cladorrhinum sp. PSN259]
MFVHPVDHSVHDSGYGSSAARSVAIGKLDTVQGREEAAHTFNVFDATEEAYETATVFSDAASLLQRPDTNKHISWFVYELACCIPLEFGMRNAGNVPSILDHFLRSFAIRLGHANAPRPQRQLMYLVYRFRHDIIKRLLRTLDAQNDCDIDSLNTGSHGNGGEIRDANLGMSLAEKVSMMWDKESNDIGSGEMDDALDDLEDDPVELDAERHILTEYREMLLDSSAYKWLQSTIRVRSTLQVPERDATITYHNIGDQIIKASAAGSPVQFSRKHTQQLCMIFTIDWDLFAFSREQQYDKPLSLVLAHAITLTGYGNNLLATTCQDYLRQTWPETGSALLSLLQQAADGGPARAVFSDSTRLTANFRNGKLYLNAVGNVFSIAEVAEQIAWIAAALRSSPSDEEAAYSTPHIDGFRIDNILGGDQIYIIGSCRVGFKMHIIHDSELAKAGKCWRGMFGNPVIVRGYPIPCRPEADTGLEISLDVVAGLTNCQRVVNFANTTFIKGFAAMLAAVRVIGDIVLWHLCYNPEGKYISYEDERAQRSPRTHTLSMGTLQRSRAPDADYDIERSELPSPGSSCVFEKITVSGSAIPFITPGASFIVGVKDKPLHLGFGRDNYVGTLMTLRQRHVVFYDSEEKRGWLVNGVCAVLHLLRAYLKFCTEDDCISSCFMYSDGDIEEASRCAAYTGAKAAFEILTNPSNQSIPLYARQSTLSEEHTARLGKKLDADATTLKTTSSNFTLKEKVDEICHILLQITAYYDDVGTQAGFGFRIRSSPRHLVEGFEFKDVAIRNDTLWPKVAKIQTGSVGWVHLIRSLRAVTLFGDGFGELFRPAWSENQTQACCSPTSLVPKGKDFLAVYGADLENMLTAKSKRRNPWRLAENIYWHSPDGVAFQSCECKTATPRGEMDTSTTKRKGKGLRGFFGLEHEGHADQPRAKNPGDRVQVLLPTTFPQLYGRGLRSPAEVVSRGAVLFGHSWKFPLRWSLTKDIPPEEGEPDPPSIDEVSNLVSDSGLGTSIGSSPLGDDKPTPTTTPPHPLYSLGSNTGFVHRGDSLSSGVGEVTAPSESSGEGIKGSRTAVPDFNASKKRPVDMLGTEEFGTAAKVRRL